MSQADAPDNEAPGEEVESAAAFLRPRKPADDEIDMTPMIDCVFLLLIFFIVQFRTDQSKTVPLPVAKYGNPVLGLESVFVTVAAGEEKTTRVYLGDQVDPSLLARSTNALDLEEEIVEYVKRGVEGPQGKKQVIIKGDGKLTASQVDQVYKAVGKAIEGQPLHIAVTSEE
jgi:biopolymer transport protein ExbD